MIMKQLSLASIGLKVYSGQIMSRVTVKEQDEIAEPVNIRVLLPKCIISDGTVNVDELVIEQLKTEPDQRRITQVGDIVIKLSTPYDAALITPESSGCLVPSFCAIIKDNGYLDKNYLLAFLNSSLCKKQLQAKVAGSIMTILSVGKIEDVEIPIPDICIQQKIGQEYIEIQQRLITLKKIAELSAKRNDVVFKELVNSNE